MPETVSDSHIQDGGQQNMLTVVFMQEFNIFGNTKPPYKDFIKHDEIYKSLATLIDLTHVVGLQRVNGMWRIYIDNLDDKVTLLSSGIVLRHKHVPLLQTNPQRLDYENTVRIREENVHLSADDGIITRPLVLRGLEIISSYREKLRIDYKLTNWERGYRIIIVKALSLKEALSRFMQFGQFKAKAIHRGQVLKTLKCAKCFEQGHMSIEIVRIIGNAVYVCNQVTKGGSALHMTRPHTHMNPNPRISRTTRAMKSATYYPKTTTKT